MKFVTKKYNVKIHVYGTNENITKYYMKIQLQSAITITYS
jgi:hypothetical protein